MAKKAIDNGTVGLCVITGLLPTIGHKYMIDFASRFVNRLHVVVSIRSFEPRITLDRAEILANHYAGTNVTIHEHYDDDAPQNDDGTPEFWAYWVALIDLAITKRKKIDFFFASEKYGQRFADALGIEFIPVDIGREILAIKGADVRHDLAASFKYILPEYKKLLSKKICITGPESCGKTTMTKWLANRLQGRWIHEWARSYLEQVGSELTDHKMHNIILGQYAAMASAPESLFNVLDTDLSATIMYYDIGKFIKPQILLDKFAETCIDTYYIVMNENIPFEVDPLRYGGDVRESKTQQWIDFYETRGLPYYVVQETDIKKQRKEVVKAVYNHFTDLREIEEFERD
jgi:NadR type nicotinamide-nucleotide adenylyltransferase